MLIVCAGPDTFRAQERARELEQAFTTKYDPTGVSVERLSSGKEGVKEILERAGTTSLFSSRRFLHVRDLIKDCPKNQLEALLRALASHGDETIVVTKEEESPVEKVLKLFQEKTQTIVYSYPVLKGKDWRAWIMQMAKKLGANASSAFIEAASAYEGDTWFIWNELCKCAAGGAQELKSLEQTQSVFDRVDSYLARRSYRFTSLVNDEDAAALLSPLLSQARTALRVRDGATQGLHPFLVKKMEAFGTHAGYVHAQALQAMFLVRAGYGADAEAMGTIE